MSTSRLAWLVQVENTLCFLLWRTKCANASKFTKIQWQMLINASAARTCSSLLSSISSSIFLSAAVTSFLKPFQRKKTQINGWIKTYNLLYTIYLKLIYTSVEHLHHLFSQLLWFYSLRSQFVGLFQFYWPTWKTWKNSFYIFNFRHIPIIIVNYSVAVQIGQLNRKTNLWVLQLFQFLTDWFILPFKILQLFQQESSLSHKSPFISGCRSGILHDRRKVDCLI